MSYQSEAALESQFIEQLNKQNYATVDIPDYDALLENFKIQFEKFNAAKLDTPLTDKEWERIFNHLLGKSVFQSAKVLRDKFVLEREDGTKPYLSFFDSDHTKNIFQVTHQTTVVGKYVNRYDVILLTMRPFEQGGKWGAKQKKEYILDEGGAKIYDRNKRQYKCNSVPATDWNEQTKAEEWRGAWAEICNQFLEQSNSTERIDHRSYERQGIDQIPTIHLGAAASQMEKRGIRTERGNLNREIEVTNQRLRQLKARIGKLQNWLKEEQQSPAPTTLADYIQSILSRKAQAGKSSVSQSIYNLKDASKMLIFLQQNQIMDMSGLDEKFAAMLDEQMDIRDKLKPIERRLPVLKKHMEQADIYFKHRGKKTLSEADQILFTAATNYLKGVMNGHTTLPVKAWKTEYATLTAEHKTLNQRYLKLKDEVKEAEQIRKSVYSVLRQEQREQQPHKVLDMEH